MKKILLILGLAAATIFGVQAVAPTSSPWSYVVSSGTTPFKSVNTATDLNGVSWTCKTDATSPYFGANWSGKNNTWNGLQFGKSNAAVLPLTLTSSDFEDFEVTQIKINASAGDGNAVSISLKVGDTEFKSDGKTSIELSTSQKEYTFTGSGSGEVTISYTGTNAKKAVYLRSLNITFQEKGSLTAPKTPTFSVENGSTVYPGTEITATCSTSKSTVCINDVWGVAESGVATYKVADDAEIGSSITLIAYAKVQHESTELTSESATITVNVAEAPKAENYTLVTSSNVIAEGMTYIIAGDNKEGSKFAIMSVDVTDNKYFNALMGTDGEKYGFEKLNNTISITPIEGTNANKIAIITLEGNSTDGFKIKNQNGNYLKMGTGKTSMSTTDKGSDATTFKISLADGVLTINGGGDTGNFSYNAATPRFANYANAQSPTFLYVKVITPDAPALHSDVETDSEGVITGSTLKFEDVPEGHSIWWRIVPEATETPADGMVKEEAEFQKYTEPVTLTAGTKGTLHYYAQHDATGGKSETLTAKVNVADVGSGIAGIEAEDGKAVYFNLQGVRVQNPENGVFIRVQNGKAVKIAK